MTLFERIGVALALPIGLLAAAAGTYQIIAGPKAFHHVIRCYPWPSGAALASGECGGGK